MAILLAIIGTAIAAGAIRALFALVSAGFETDPAPRPGPAPRKRGKRGGSRNRKSSRGNPGPAVPPSADPGPAAPETPATPNQLETTAESGDPSEPVQGLPPFPWWDDRSCWGCEKSCKFRGFKQGTGNLWAEMKGASLAALAAMRENPGVYDPSELNDGKGAVRKARKDAGFKTGKAQEWDYICEKCGEYQGRLRAGLPALDPLPPARDLDGAPIVADPWDDANPF